MTRGRRTVTGISLLLLSAVIGGCGAGSPRGTANRSEPAHVDQRLAAQVLQSNLDEDPVRSPTEYLPLSKLVVSGHVMGIVSGRILFAKTKTDPVAERYVTLQVYADELIKGEMPKDGIVNVELPGNGYDLEQFNEAIPPGTKIAMYLYTAIQETDELPIDYEDSAVPPSAEFWQPMGSKALIIGGEQGVFMPMAGLVVPNGSLRDQLP